jgi:hypothetical protein
MPALFKKIDMPYVGDIGNLVDHLEDPDHPLAKSHKYLEELRATIKTNPPTADLDKVCQRTEQAVSVILREAAFLAGYTLLTVRNVMVSRSRFEDLAYELDMGPLKATQGIDLNLYKDEAFRRKTSFADTFSVILSSNEDHIDKSLNLSPFVIDKNTFVQMKKSETTDQDKLAHLFMLGWEEGDRLYYTAIEHSFFTSLEKESDQIHTDMSLEDFTEGRNIGNKDKEKDEFDLGFGDFDDGAPDAGGISESQKVFQMLKDQYEMMKADLV